MEIDINNCTLQEAVDYAVKKIVEQGGQCAAPCGACMYGDGEGRHCAVGWLLPEEDRDLMDCGDGVDHLVHRYADRVPAVVRENVEAMAALQDFHDDGSRWGRVGRLHLLANEHNIDTSGPHWQAWIDMGEG